MRHALVLPQTYREKTAGGNVESMPVQDDHKFEIRMSCALLRSSPCAMSR